MEEQKERLLEDVWKKQQYLHQKGRTQSSGTQPSGSSYLVLLKDFRNKLELQLIFEREEMTLITSNIAVKCRELKASLVETWKTVGFESRNQTATGETKHEQKYT